jgi:hypothetical protein
MNIKGLISVFLIVGFIAAPAFAEEKVEKTQLEVMHQSILNLIKQLAKKGILSKEDAEKMLKDADESTVKSAAVQSALAASAVAAQSGVVVANSDTQSGVAAASAVPAVEPVAPGVVRVPYIPESMKLEMTEIIKHEVLAQAKGERWGDPGAMPEWLSRISFDGEFRLRNQDDRFPLGNVLPSQYNPSGLTLISNTTNNHDYTRILARLGMKAQVSEDTIVVFRIGTGNTNSVSSGNQTMGNQYSNYGMELNRAYVQSNPYNWLELTGGKMPNPWLSTDLVWDANINVEGVTAKFKPQLSEQWYSFLTLGAYPYQDIQSSDIVLANSKSLYAAQIGVAWRSVDSSLAQFGVAYYDFQNVEGMPEAVGSQFYSQTAAQYMQKGNTLMYVYSDPTTNTYLYGLASKFKELDVTAKLDWAAFDTTHIMLTGDYVRNLGYDQNQIIQRTGLNTDYIPAARINGREVMLSVGVPKIQRAGEWQANLAYKYVEADAVLDALTDQDFHLGGTNAKGYVIGGSYGLDKNTWLTLRWLSTDVIDGPQLSIDTLQVDLNTRF